jgi:hypothetical protein
VESHDTNLSQLRDSIRIARYDVDPVAVADAIVRRRWKVAVVPRSGIRPASSSGRRSRAQVSCIGRRGAGSRARALAA